MVGHQQHHLGKDGGGGGKGQLDTGKYVRYTPEQVEALERLYSECPKPSSMRRQQLIRECPILANIEPKQIKVWFQNRRYEVTSERNHPSKTLRSVIEDRKRSSPSLDDHLGLIQECSESRTLSAANAWRAVGLLADWMFFLYASEKFNMLRFKKVYAL